MTDEENTAKGDLFFALAAVAMIALFIALAAIEWRNMKERQSVADMQYEVGRACLLSRQDIQDCYLICEAQSRSAVRRCKIGVADAAISQP